MYRVTRKLKKQRTRFNTARAICRRYMADVTRQTSVPGKNKGGVFAILIADVGEVWLSRTVNFKQTLLTYANPQVAPDCVKEAIKRGSALELYFLTRPDDFDEFKLRDELVTGNLLAARKTREMYGPGNLYVIRHDVTHDYFVVADRQGLHETTILSNYYGRMLNQSGTTRNLALDDFITHNADDIIKQVRFSISHIDKFEDREDEWLKRQVYIDEAKFGKSLNWMSVD